MKIRPLQDRIIVKRVDEEETSKGGIIIPDSAKEKPQEAKVIEVGPGAMRRSASGLIFTAILAGRTLRNARPLPFGRGLCPNRGRSRGPSPETVCCQRVPHA